MELRHLRYFIKAAELLNFTKAAEALYVSQPTLSVQIHQLEQELGADLFTRVGRNVRLSQAGERFLIHARQAVRTLEEGADEVNAIQGVLRGNLSLIGFPLIASKMLTRWVPEFKQKFPDVRVHIRAGASDDIESSLMSGVVDLGFGTPPKDQEFSFDELFSERNVLFVSTDHPLTKKKRLRVADLKDLPLALPSERLAAPSLALGKYFEESDWEPNVQLTCDDGHALLALVRNGNFGTLLPPWACLDEPGIVAVALPPPAMLFRIGAIYTRLTPAAAAFCQLVKERLADKKLEFGTEKLYR